MKHGIANHHIRKSIREGHLFEATDLEVFRRQSRLQRSGEFTDMVNAGSIRVHRKDFAALAQQMNQIASVAASGVDNTHPGSDISTQNLIEYVDIDLPELFLNRERHCASGALVPCRANSFRAAIDC
jgi:hypothetical protein